jgi:hypothetical protein
MVAFPFDSGMSRSSIGRFAVLGVDLGLALSLPLRLPLSWGAI